MTDTFRFYDEPEGWVECETIDGGLIVSAHVYNDGKYSRAMMRKFIKIVDAVDIVITELRYNYLVEWFSKHFKITHRGEHIYEIRNK